MTQPTIALFTGDPAGIGPDEFSRFNRQEFERFGRLIKQANIKMN